MFGYIRPSKPHLSEQDEARFQSVYCGLCHELGRKYGFAARFVLNFDFTFLAILLSDAQEPECESCRCAAHPCKAQCIMAHTVALETAADTVWCSPGGSFATILKTTAFSKHPIPARGAFAARRLPQGEDVRAGI